MTNPLNNELLRPARDVGLVGYGAYVPRYRLPASEVARVWTEGASALPINMMAEGFVPQLDTHGNLYREFRIVVVIAAIVALAIPALDAASKEALRETTTEDRSSPSRFAFRQIFSNRYAALGMGVLFGVALAFIQKDTPFLYFQF